VHDIAPFAVVLLVAGAALIAAIGSHRLAEVLRVPAPAVFLLAAAIASDLVPRLGGLSTLVDQRIVTIALIVILFQGGMHIGWKRLRPVAGAVAWVGVAGTAVTAVAVAAAAHWLFGFDWLPALLIGAALAPTDPAVVFSVLGRREVPGRTGTLLEGESGANDPVGIALMASLLAAHGGGWGAVGSGTLEFLIEMSVGGALGVIGGLLLPRLARQFDLPSPALYPVQAIAFALALYGATAALHGSGFLAVFLAGLLCGDVDLPRKQDVHRFSAALAGLAEMVAFVVLGLSIELDSVFSGTRVWTALGLAAVLFVLVRPLLVGVLLVPVRLTNDERVFVLFAGLKGAVPILLGTYALVDDAPQATAIYDIVFVVVLLSVVLQGALVPTLVKRLSRTGQGKMRPPEGAGRAR
jgi:cell volume regulation protein A